MSITKRLLAGFCAAALCLGISACGNTDDSSSKGEKGDSKSESGAAADETTESKDANAVELDESQKQTISELQSQLPDVELSNKTIKFISHWNLNPGDGQVVPPYLQLFRDKYQGEIEWVETTWDNRYSDIIKLVLSKDSPDFFSAMDNDGFPKGALKGIFEPVDDYIDFSSELWNTEGAQNAVEMYKFDGKHYVAATGSYPNTICIYNTKTIADNGLEDPAELFEKGEWNWSKFKEMCVAFTNADEEKYGLDGWWYEIGIADTTGVPMIGLDSSGKAVSNINDETFAKGQNFLTELEQAKVYFNRNENGGNPRGDGTTGNGMGDNLTLFYPCGFWGIEGAPDSTTAFGDVEAGEIMFVPMPKPDDSDRYYIDARLDNGYYLVKNAPNPEGFAAFMNCLQLASKSQEAQDVATAQLKDVYKWNDKMIDMKQKVIDLCNANPVFDFLGGVSDDVSATTGSIKTATISAEKPMTWDEVKKEYNDALEFQLKEANEQIPEV